MINDEQKLLWARIRNLERQLGSVKEDLLQSMLRMQLHDHKHYGYIHIAQLTPASVFNFVELGGEDVSLHGYRIKLGSLRYQVFKRSRTCVTCGVEGTVFGIDTQGSMRRRGRAHFNLYGIRPSGRVVMLTKDHIVAKANGGGNGLGNLQTMCQPCNQEKADD